MLMLKGNTIQLRALEPGDLDFLYELENNTEIWEVSGTLVPYSKQVLKLYLDNAHRDIYEVKQLRLCIEEPGGRTVGLIDLFDFDPKHRRAGLGIIVLESRDRNRGYASEALELMCSYAFSILGLHQLFANVGAENKPSLHLFKKLGFEEVGVKREWIRSGPKFKDEVMLQKINS